MRVRLRSAVSQIGSDRAYPITGATDPIVQTMTMSLNWSHEGSGTIHSHIAITNPAANAESATSILASQSTLGRASMIS